MTRTSVREPPLLRLEGFGVKTRSGWSSQLIDLALWAGQCVAVVGRPGSGKTLILERLAGVHRPSVEPVSSAYESSLVLVPQDARLAVLPTDRVWSLVGLSGVLVRLHQLTGKRFPYSQEEKRGIELMEALHLDANRIAELPFRDLSATERRCVLLVAALLSGPKVLALDGWDEQMDGTSRKAIARLLQQKMADGMALIVSTRKLPLDDLGRATVVSLDASNSGVENVVPLLRKSTPRPPHEHPLLEINRMTVQRQRWALLRKRPAAVIIDGASLFVRHGETMVVLGASGSGKTTLLQAISGLHPASRGTVRVDNHDVTFARGRRANRLRRDVQLVFQDAAAVLDGNRTVQAHLEEAMSLRKGPISGSPGEWLERLGLSPRLLGALADQLGAAESQRVDLARSLIVAPKLVLFDSPEVAGAGTDGGVIAALLSNEKAHGRSFLVATSDPDLARSLADRVAVLHAGRVVELGTVDEVMNRPAHPLSESLITSEFVPRSDPLSPASGCPFVVQCSRRKLPQCDEREPMLAPLQSISDLTGEPEAGQRRVACFYPIVN